MSDYHSHVEDCIRRAADQTGASLAVPEAVSGEPPLQITLLGQPQQNLFGILQTLFGGFEPLDRAMLRGYRCTLAYGESDRISTVRGQERTETPADSIAKNLMILDPAGTAAALEIARKHDALRDLRLRVIASDSDYEDVDWTDILTNSDYCFFTLTSTALLSMCERRVLRNYLLPQMQNELGVILTNDNLILEDDRPDIEESLKNFFQDTVPFYRVPEEDAGALLGALSALPGRVAELRERRVIRTERSLLGQALREVDLQMEVLASGSARLDEAMELLTEKAKALPARQESACRRARMRYTSRMKVDVSEKLSTFHQSIVEKLRAEINEGEDIAEMRDILPGYISDQWNAEAERVLRDVRASAEEMQRDLGSYVEKDIRSYIESGADVHTADYVFRLTDLYAPERFQSDETAFRFEEARGDSRAARYGAIAGGIALVLLSHPILGATIAIYGAHKAKKDEKTRFLLDNRHALIAASEEMCRETFDDIVVWMDGVISSIERNLASCVETCYQKMMDAMIQALNNRKRDRSSHDGQLESLRVLKAEIEGILN